MKKVIATTMAAFLVAQVASAVSASVDFASAYVFRGETANDGFVIQPSIEGEVKGVTVGVWANIDVDNVANDQVSEIDLYLGYGLGSIGGWDLSAGYCEYTYPGADDAPDTDPVTVQDEDDGESEISLTASGTVLGYDISISAYADIDEQSSPQYIEVAHGGSTAIFGVPVDYGIVAGYDNDDFEDNADSETGLGFMAYSVAYETGGGTLSLTYIDEIDEEVTDVTETVVLSYSLGL